MSTKLAERVCWLTPRWSLITEMQIRSGAWFIFPSVSVTPPYPSSGNHFLDVTFSWLRFSIIFRRE